MKINPVPSGGVPSGGVPSGGGTPVAFSVNAAGEVVIHPAQPAKGKRPAADRFEAVRGKADVKWRTDDLMKLLRAED